MYLATPTPLEKSVNWVGLIQVDVAPRPASTLAKPQLELPDTLMNELVPAVPVVKRNAFNRGHKLLSRLKRCYRSYSLVS